MMALIIVVKSNLERKEWVWNIFEKADRIY